MNDNNVLRLEKINKSYSASMRGDQFLRVVDDLSLCLTKGEAYGLIGPNGAGKTTTVKMIVGLTTPNSGTISIFGKPNTSIEIRQRIGFMPESPTFYSYLSARELMYFIARLFKIEKSQIPEKIDQILKSVGLEEAAGQAIRGFSKGMRQRLGLAQALVCDPEILILDEPLDGLDPLGRSDIKEYLLKMKKMGTTILVSSHILSDVEEICDRIGIIDQGALIEEGKVDKIIPKGMNLEEFFVQTIKSKNKLIWTQF